MSCPMCSQIAGCFSKLQTDQTFPSKQSQRDKLITNEDRSIDLYFGPKAPAGKEANWTQTVPGKGWFSLLRLYSPTDTCLHKKGLHFCKPLFYWLPELGSNQRQTD